MSRMHGGFDLRGLAGGLLLAAALPALAQEGSPEASAAASRAAAEAAAESAREAEAELEVARQRLEVVAEQAAKRAQAAAEAAETAARAEAKAEQAALEAQAQDPVFRAQRAAEEARERAVQAELKAEAAEVQARRAMERVKALEQKLGYDRTGFYLGATLAQVPQDFELSRSFRTHNTTSAGARLGYRAHAHFAVEARFDAFEDFKIKGTVRNADGSGRDPVEFDLDAYSITGNVRAFILPWRVQPWLGIGGGAFVSNLKGRNLTTGGRIETRGREADPMFRISGGVDFYLTPNFVLNADFAYNTVGGTRDYVSFGQLGAGLEFRF